MIIKRLPLLVAGGIGYVLGAKAGKERYEQILGTFNKVKDDPRVQDKAQQAVDLAKEKAPVVQEKLSGAAGAASSKVKSATGNGSSDSNGSSDPAAQLNPESTIFQENSGPQGTLP
jgi:hypothetical protein